MSSSLLSAVRLAPLAGIARQHVSASCTAAGGMRGLQHVAGLAARRSQQPIVRFARTSTRGGGPRVATAEGALGETYTAGARSSGSSSSGARMAVAGAATLGIAGLGFYGATAASQAVTDAGKINADAIWPSYVQQRVHDTFFALGAGIAMTAGATAALWQSGAANVFMSRPLVAGIGGMVVTIGTMMVTRSIPAENKLAKYAGLAAFNTAIAFSLCPLVALGGPLLLRAAAITGGIVGSLSFVAANSPSDKFLSMAGPLSMGLGAVVIASLGAAFFPAASVAPMLHNVSMYGGLVLFSGFVLYDTSKLVTNAKHKQTFDPVNEQFGIYLDIINIFTRIVFMLSGNSKRK